MSGQLASPCLGARAPAQHPTLSRHAEPLLPRSSPPNLTICGRSLMPSTWSTVNANSERPTLPPVFFMNSSATAGGGGGGGAGGARAML